MKIIAPENPEIFGVKTNNHKAYDIKFTAKAFEILSSKLYKNKIAAVIRELSCNAYDSHVAANTLDKPFDVHLPSDFEPYFSIRDYGTGLSPEEVDTIYTTFFESTKENSNTFIGNQGLGSKTPYALVDVFSVTSYHNHTQYVYECFKLDGIPHTVPRSEMPTDEPNGLEIKMAVAIDQIYPFCNTAQSIFQWFETPPNVTGNSSYIQKEYPTFNKDGWANQDFTFSAIMGQVCYPLDRSLIKTYGLQNCLVIKFDIGDLDVQAGREELSYDKVTIANIENRLQKISENIDTEYQKIFGDCKNIFEADLVYKNNVNNPLFRIKSPTFKGTTLNASTIKSFFSQHADRKNIIEFNRFDKEYVPTLDDYVIFISMNYDKKDNMRLREYLKNNPKVGYFIRPSSLHNLSPLLDSLDGINVVYSRDIPLKKQTAYIRAAHHTNVRSSIEQKIDLADAGVYILTRNLEWEHPISSTKSVYDDARGSILRLLGKHYKGTAYYIPYSRKNGVKSWQNAYDYLRPIYEEQMKDANFVKELRKARMHTFVMNDRVMTTMSNKVEYLLRHIKSKSMRAYLEKLKSYCTSYWSSTYNLKDWIRYQDIMGIAHNVSDPKQQFKEFQEKYPLLCYLISSRPNSHEDLILDIAMKDIEAYIQSKDHEDNQ